MSNEQDLICQARDAIGEGKPESDWKVTPAGHAALFKAEAQSLATWLAGPKMKQLGDLYEESNGKAIRARDEFKQTVGRANKAIFWTASTSAFGSAGPEMNSL